MRGFNTILAVSLIPFLGCGIRQAVEWRSCEIPGMDYGPAPTDYDRIVDSFIKNSYDLGIDSYGEEWMGPYRGCIERVSDGEMETVYGWEVHVLFTNDIHYMVLIRDSRIVGSVECGNRSGGFGLLDFGKPICN